VVCFGALNSKNKPKIFFDKFFAAHNTYFLVNLAREKKSLAIPGWLVCVHVLVSTIETERKLLKEKVVNNRMRGEALGPEQ
jgi:hypothetical protein